MCVPVSTCISFPDSCVIYKVCKVTIHRSITTIYDNLCGSFLTAHASASDPLEMEELPN